jgi:hypothetical protein
MEDRMPKRIVATFDEEMGIEMKIESMRQKLTFSSYLVKLHVDAMAAKRAKSDLRNGASDE